MAKSKKAAKKRVTAKKKAAISRTGLLSRFAGLKNRETCIAELLKQDMVAGSRELAEAILDNSKPVDFASDDVLIRQDATDTDVYFLLVGSTRIMIKGAFHKDRAAGTTVGEMAAIEPTNKRSATVLANNDVVALKMSSASLLGLGQKYPLIWREIARMLSRRLFERNSQLLAPNDRPRLFIISSVESLNIADGISLSLAHDVRPVVWRDGIFLASDYALQSLEDAAEASDFAVAIARDDDMLESRGKKFRTLRDNVVFELGLFMGILGRKRTFLLVPEGKNVKLPSDLQGLTCIRYRMPDKGEPVEQAVGVACAAIRQRVTALNTRVRIKRES